MRAMSRAAWLSLKFRTSLENLLPRPKKSRPLAAPTPMPSWRFARVPGSITSSVVQARTKSEARPLLAAKMGLYRLSPGTIVERVPDPAPLPAHLMRAWSEQP